jgi:hypothetical protein
MNATTIIDMCRRPVRARIYLLLAGPAIGGCSDFDTQRVTGVESISAARKAAPDLDAELPGYLARPGFTGSVASPLESRLGRRIDRQLADLGRLRGPATATPTADTAQAAQWKRDSHVRTPMTERPSFTWGRLRWCTRIQLS